jgi:DNA-binding response OmpR family regulator
MIILLVENDFILAPMMREILSFAGYSVLGPVSNSPDALRLCDETRPDLALIDIGLSGKEDGISLAAELDRAGRIPSIFVTAQLAEKIQDRDYALGVLQKPFSVETLLTSVDVAVQIIRGQSTPSPLPKGFALFARMRGE